MRTSYSARHTRVLYRRHCVLSFCCITTRRKVLSLLLQSPLCLTLPIFLLDMWDTHTHSHNADTHSLVPRLYIWRSQGPRLDTHTQFRHTTHHIPGKIREFLGSSATLLRDFSIVSASPSKILPTDNQRDLTQNPMPSCHSNT